MSYIVILMSFQTFSSINYGLISSNLTCCLQALQVSQFESNAKSASHIN